MNYYLMLNSEDGFVLQEVKGKQCVYCPSAFIYKNEESYYKYSLVDIDSGFVICRTKKLKDLQDIYNLVKNKYLNYKKTDAYKIKVERLQKLVLMNNYKKGS